MRGHRWTPANPPERRGSETYRHRRRTKSEREREREGDALWVHVPLLLITSAMPTHFFWTLSLSLSLSLTHTHARTHTHTHTHTNTHAHTQGSWGPVKWAAELLGILSESSSEGDCGARERNDAGGRWGKRRRQKHSVQKRSVSDSRTSYFQAYLKSRCRDIYIGMCEMHNTYVNKR